MGRRFSTPESAQAHFLAYLKGTTLAPRTITFYTETVHAVTEYLKKNGIEAMPDRMSVQDLRRLLDCMARDNLAIATRKGYLSALKKYVTLFKNAKIFDLDYRLPNDMRPKVDWLDEDQARVLISCEKTPIQEIVVHCELCLGMRRVEVIRLRPEDLHGAEQYLEVRGKGAQGGKPRLIPYAADTSRIMNLAINRRNEMIRAAYARFPVSTSVPDNLILWTKGGRLHAYSEEGYGLDKVVTEPLSTKVGFSFSNHTLRRTFGRALYRAGVQVATIAKILGHESTEVTLRYIGVDLDDMRGAMKLNLFSRPKEDGKMEQNEIGQIIDGSLAQIKDEDWTLATVIFGSNSAAFDWADFWLDLNNNTGADVSLPEVQVLSSGSEARQATHLHTNTHTPTIRGTGAV